MIDMGEAIGSCVASKYNVTDVLVRTGRVGCAISRSIGFDNAQQVQCNRRLHTHLNII